MPAAGYCGSCGEYVWLDSEGCCANGHPAADISSIYTPVTPLPVEPEDRARSRRRNTVMSASLALVFLAALGACGAFIFMLSHLNSPNAPDEYGHIVESDYPGWKQLGYDAWSRGGADGPETEHVFSLIPPGRDYHVCVVYLSRNGDRPVCQDGIFRAGAAFGDRAASLLDFIDKEYVSQDREVLCVQSTAPASVSIQWMESATEGPRTVSLDDLGYDKPRDVWSVWLRTEQ